MKLPCYWCKAWIEGLSSYYCFLVTTTNKKEQHENYQGMNENPGGCGAAEPSVDNVNQSHKYNDIDLYISQTLYINIYAYPNGE